jgi:hypothetical protein
MTRTAKPKTGRKKASAKKPWPKVLYPLEPTSIPPEKIREVVAAVIAERKAASRK